LATVKYATGNRITMSVCHGNKKNLTAAINKFERISRIRQR